MQLGVIFDMDGVLVMSEEAHWLSWRDVAAQRGVELQYGTFLSCFGRVNADCIRIMFGDSVPAAEAEAIAARKEAAFRDLVRQRMPLAPGAVALLSSLQLAGASLAVGSSAPRENVDLVLDVGDIRRYFGGIVDGSQVTKGKPAPDVFLQAGRLLRIPSARCAVIEDAPAGILAARAAGMTAIGVSTTHSAQQLLDAGAHRVLPSLKDVTLPGILELVPA